MRNWDRIPVPQRVADAYGALDHLKSLSYVEGDKIGVVGWSWGGSAALYDLNLEKRLRVSSTFAGAVAFYPNYKYMTRSRHWDSVFCDIATPAIWQHMKTTDLFAFISHLYWRC
jgi:dienelactone hydrolase